MALTIFLFFAKARLPILTFLPTNTIVFNAVPANAFSPIIVTDDGMVRVANEAHPINAPALILVTDAGKITCFNEVHPENAFASIIDTDAGKTTCINDVHPENVFAGIEVILVAAIKLTVCTCVFANAPTLNVVSELAAIVVTFELSAPAEIAPLNVAEGVV